jgi:glycosyltransferase involved in cell wall biosynthesis
MADAAVEILQDPVIWQRQSEASRHRAVEGFAASRVIPMYERVYEEVLGKHTEETSAA